MIPTQVTIWGSVGPKNCSNYSNGKWEEYLYLSKVGELLALKIICSNSLD